MAIGLVKWTASDFKFFLVLLLSQELVGVNVTLTSLLYV